MIDIGVRLRELRSKSGLSQHGLAQKSGLSRDGIARIETGEHKAPLASTLSALAAALGCGVGDFFSPREREIEVSAAKEGK